MQAAKDFINTYLPVKSTLCTITAVTIFKGFMHCPTSADSSSLGFERYMIGMGSLFASSIAGLRYSEQKNDDNDPNIVTIFTFPAVALVTDVVINKYILNK